MRRERCHQRHCRHCRQLVSGGLAGAAAAKAVGPEAAATGPAAGAAVVARLLAISENNCFQHNFHQNTGEAAVTAVIRGTDVPMRPARTSAQRDVGRPVGVTGPGSVSSGDEPMLAAPAAADAKAPGVPMTLRKDVRTRKSRPTATEQTASLAHDERERDHPGASGDDDHPAAVDRQGHLDREESESDFADGGCCGHLVGDP